MRSISEEFGINVRRARKKREISQQKLAELSDLDFKTINRIENGQGNPELLTMYCIAEALNVSLRQLFNFEEDEEDEK